MPSSDRPLALDVTRLLKRRWRKILPTGVDRVGLEYLRHFRGRVLLTVRIGRRFLSCPMPQSLLLTDVLLSPASGRRWALSFWLRMLKSLRPTPPGSILLNTGHSGIEHRDYPVWIRAAGLRPVHFIHDLIPISHPQFSRAGEAERHVQRMRSALLTASAILVNSQDTAAALMDFAAAQGLPVPPITVALLAPAPLRNTSDQAPHRTDPYFVVLGTIEGRKNHALLLNVWDNLMARSDDLCPRLLIVGQRGWRCQAVFDRLDNDRRLQGVIQEVGRCPDAELTRILLGARALLFPSFVEGYGLPLAEALMLRVPVIASDLPVFTEIAGDVHERLDPSDVQAWTDMIDAYTPRDSARRTAQLERMSAFAAPTWPDHFRVVDRVLDQLS